MTELPGPSPSGYRPVAAYPAGWYADPWIAGGMRYWDGWAWTGQVAAKVKPPKPPHQQLPLAVALTTVATLLVSLVGVSEATAFASKALRERFEPEDLGPELYLQLLVGDGAQQKLAQELFSARKRKVPAAWILALVDDHALDEAH